MLSNRGLLFLSQYSYNDQRAHSFRGKLLFFYCSLRSFIYFSKIENEIERAFKKIEEKFLIFFRKRKFIISINLILEFNERLVSCQNLPLFIGYEKGKFIKHLRNLNGGSLEQISILKFSLFLDNDYSIHPFADWTMS